MCPPEYAELEGGKPNGATFRNLNHTTPGPCYASTSVLDAQYPLPPLPPPTTSSEEGGHTGETSCGSGDSSSGGATAESRARRSRGRTESRASGSNSDSSGRGTTDTSRLDRRTSDRQTDRQTGGHQVETRLTASAAPSPYHRPPPGLPPATDPGLPPVPPLRGLSSYQVKCLLEASSQLCL